MEVRLFGLTATKMPAREYYKMNYMEKFEHHQRVMGEIEKLQADYPEVVQRATEASVNTYQSRPNLKIPYPIHCGQIILFLMAKGGLMEMSDSHLDSLTRGLGSLGIGVKA